MMAETIVKNKITNNIIDSSRIINQDKNGVIFTNKKCWNFVPGKDIETTKKDVDKYYKEEDTIIPPENRQSERLVAEKYDGNSSYISKACYNFGLRFNSTYNLKSIGESVIVSSEINLGVFSYITLSVDEKIKNAAAEYYIISGNTEIPILPEGTEKIEKEKLFYNIPTRFIINNAVSAPMIFEENTQIEKEYNNITFEEFEKHHYYISYVPGGECIKIIPKNKTVKLKIIIRKFQEDSFCSLSNITINKYGGKLTWI